MQRIEVMTALKKCCVFILRSAQIQINANLFLNRDIHDLLYFAANQHFLPLESFFFVYDLEPEVNY